MNYSEYQSQISKAESLEALAEENGYSLYLEEAISDIENAPDSEMAEDGIFTDAFIEAARDLAFENAQADEFSRYAMSMDEQNKILSELDRLLEDSHPMKEAA